MSDIFEIPRDVIEFLFNVNQGTHIDRRCAKCDKLTDQVVVSYSELSFLSLSEAEKIVGRFMDFIPGVRFFLGKPTLCRCGRLNR